VVAVCVNLGGMRFRQKLFEDIDQLFEFGVAGEKVLDLGTKVSTFPAGLLVRKYVVVVLHDVVLESFGGIITLIGSVFRCLRVECL
jgi:hypothetical protein